LAGGADLVAHWFAFGRPCGSGVVAVPEAAHVVQRVRTPQWAGESRGGRCTAQGAAASERFSDRGVGASAGGLEAFTELLQNLPPEPGLAILLVLHLEPHHKSHLAELLSGKDKLAVKEAVEGMTVEANHVYLIPPNKNMALTDGSLTLTPRSPIRGQHMPIDHLFRSLAEVLKGRAIGVILSGGGTDGTLGFQAIKAEGGITFAQDEKSAKQNSMPRSAILEELVDNVLPPAEIARQLARIVQHPYSRSGSEEPAAETTDSVEHILRLLRARTGVDFSHYKRATINRRILRRMALRSLENVGE